MKELNLLCREEPHGLAWLTYVTQNNRQYRITNAVGNVLDGLKSFLESKNIITHLPAFFLSNFNEASRAAKNLFQSGPSLTCIFLFYNGALSIVSLRRSIMVHKLNSGKGK